MTSDELSGKDSNATAGRRFGSNDLEVLVHPGEAPIGSPTWRGWLMGILSVALLCKVVPVADYVLKGTFLSLNVLPFASIFLTFALVLVYNISLSLFRSALGLTIQDIALVFGMTMVANHIPGHGLMGFLTAEMSGPIAYATPENRWHEILHPYIPQLLIPQEPLDPNADGAHPVQWFYTGLPEDENIPWQAWAGPYGLWALAVLFLYGMMFSCCALMEKHWSEVEKLPFPLAQVPGDMMAGLTSTGGADPRATSFLKQKSAWCGILFTLALHSWNVMENYFDAWPGFPLRNTYFGAEYLTEPPFKALNPVWIIIYPSIIGLTYLISLEISFSLWFFYIVVLKVAVLVAIGFGLGAMHSHFLYQPSGHFGMFINLGTGGLMAVVLISIYRARAPLLASLREALGLRHPDRSQEDGGFSARALWILLSASWAGSIAWLVVFNVHPFYAILGTLACLMLTLGVARLVSHGGIFFPQIATSPIELTALAVPPAIMGAQSFVPLSMWSRIASFDYFRLSPTVPLITAMNVGRLAGLRRKSLFGGLALALVLALFLGFFGFFSTVYEVEGGASTSGWVFNTFPQREYRRISDKVASIESYEARLTEAGPKGLPPSEVPQIAQRDEVSIRWLIIGCCILLGFELLRGRFFWWPHSIGFVIWTGQRAISLMWFSFFLGWAIKWAIVHFGGSKVFTRSRPFFVGLIVGEAIAALFWIGMAYLTENEGPYKMHFN